MLRILHVFTFPLHWNYRGDDLLSRFCKLWNSSQDNCGLLSVITCYGIPFFTNWSISWWYISWPSTELKQSSKVRSLATMSDESMLIIRVLQCVARNTYIHSMHAVCTRLVLSAVLVSPDCCHECSCTSTLVVTAELLFTASIGVGLATGRLSNYPATKVKRLQMVICFYPKYICRTCHSHAPKTVELSISYQSYGNT